MTKQSHLSLSIQQWNEFLPEILPGANKRVTLSKFKVSLNFTLAELFIKCLAEAVHFSQQCKQVKLEMVVPYFFKL